MSGQEKTEKATPKRRQDERKKGNIFQSKDIITVGSIAASFYVLKFWMPYIYRFTGDTFKKYIGLIETTNTLDTNFTVHLFMDIAKVVASVSGLMIAAVILVGIILTGAQTRFIFSKEAFKFKFSKLNPLSGIKRMFSLRSLIEILKNIIKIIIIGIVIYNVIIKNLKFIPKLMYFDMMSAVKFVFDVIMSAVNSVIIYFVAISLIDYIYQWWEYEKNIKMTKQEVKDEFKNTEGNPEIKGKIKEKQRRISMMRMMQQVPNADVIIRNPTHYAIAVKYDENSSRAPVVIAKGQDNVALKIIQKAVDSKIHIIENKPLARALYSKVELNHEIPVEYYEPIAEILAWVYKLKEKGK